VDSALPFPQRDAIIFLPQNYPRAGSPRCLCLIRQNRGCNAIRGIHQGVAPQMKSRDVPRGEKNRKMFPPARQIKSPPAFRGNFTRRERFMRGNTAPRSLVLPPSLPLPPLSLSLSLSGAATFEDASGEPPTDFRAREILSLSPLPPPPPPLFSPFLGLIRYLRAIRTRVISRAADCAAAS